MPSPTSQVGQKWRVRFFTVWTGQAFSMVGSALVRFTLIWWLTERTGSATVLTTASIVSILPFIALAPVAGVLVDRWNRRRVMIIADAMIALFTLLLAFLYWLGIVQVWHVYAVLFLRSLGDGFQDPAMRASTSLMVPKSELARVGGMNETLQGVINIVSPPLGAVLLEIWTLQGTLSLDVITAAMAIGPLLFITVPQPQAREPHVTRKSVFQDMGEGLRYMLNWRGLFYMCIVLAVMRFFMAPSFSLLPLMVTRHFGGGALELGWMSSAHGFGFVLGGLILSVWGGFKRRTMTALVGLIGLGIGSVGFGLVPGNAFWLAAGLMFVRTAMLPMLRGSVLAIFQSHVPFDMQARVFTLLVSLVSAMAPLGLLVGGPLADRFGVSVLFIGSGAGCLAIALIWALTPTIMRLEDHSHDELALSAAAGPADAATE